MAKYELTVNVTYTYEVEADTRDEAEQQGWAYEDYRHFGAVDSIEIAELEEEDDEDDEDEDEEDDYDLSDVEADADTLASAGHGTDEDYGYYGE